jgi:hypothetical protein
MWSESPPGAPAYKTLTQVLGGRGLLDQQIHLSGLVYRPQVAKVLARQLVSHSIQN